MLTEVTAVPARPHRSRADSGRSRESPRPISDYRRMSRRRPPLSHPPTRPDQHRAPHRAASPPERFSIARLRDFTDSVVSSAAAYSARPALPVTTGGAADSARTGRHRVERDRVWGRPLWHGHRTFHVDGSSFSMSDTCCLQQRFGQPRQPASGVWLSRRLSLALFHAGTGVLLQGVGVRVADARYDSGRPAAPRVGGRRCASGRPGVQLCPFGGTCCGGELHGVFQTHQNRSSISGPTVPTTALARPAPQGLPASRWLKRLGVQDQLVQYFKPKTTTTWLSCRSA